MINVIKGLTKISETCSGIIPNSCCRLLLDRLAEEFVNVQMLCNCLSLQRLD